MLLRISRPFPRRGHVTVVRVRMRRASLHGKAELCRDDPQGRTADTPNITGTRSPPGSQGSASDDAVVDVLTALRSFPL